MPKALLLLLFVEACVKVQILEFTYNVLPRYCTIRSDSAAQPSAFCQSLDLLCILGM